MKKKAKFDYKEFLKSVAVLAVPIALQNLLTTTGSMVDTMMIGSMGELAVGAVGLCSQFSSLLLSCYWGLLGGGILFISQYWGAEDDDGILRAFGIMLTTMMSIAIIGCILAVTCPAFIMHIYTDKEVYFENGTKYLRIVGFAYIFQVLATAISGLLRSTERVKIPLVASIASVAVNLFLNWVFIFGNLGAPRLGVQGAAIATVSSAVVNVLILVGYAAFTKYPYLFRVRKFFAWNRPFIKEFMIKCFPMICNELFIGIALLISNMVLGRQVAEGIAALAVFRTFEGMVIAFFAGFSSASAVLVGKRVGAGEHEDAYQIGNRLIYLCMITIFFVCVVLFSLHKPLLHAMGLSGTEPGTSFYYGRGMLLIYCMIAVFRMAFWISNDTSRASGDATTGTIMEIAFMWLVNLPLLCLAGLVWKLPFLWVYVFAYIDEPIRFVLMQIHMHSGGWVRPVTEKGKETLEAFRKEHPIRAFYSKFGLKKEIENK